MKQRVPICPGTHSLSYFHPSSFHFGDEYLLTQSKLFPVTDYVICPTKRRCRKELRAYFFSSPPLSPQIPLPSPHIPLLLSTPLLSLSSPLPFSFHSIPFHFMHRTIENDQQSITRIQLLTTSSLSV